MNNEPYWAASALERGLSPGRKLRMNCACGEGKTLLVSHNGTGMMAYCFREKQAWVHRLSLTLAQRLKAREGMLSAELELSAHTEPPDGFDNPSDWPADARVWMYSAGLCDVDLKLMRARFNCDMQRVVVPLSLLDGTAGWIARRIAADSTGPKYLFPAGMRRGSGAWFGNRHLASQVVVTEDVLSAYRVAAADTGVLAVAALGTTLDAAACTRIARMQCPVAVWLDPDRYGRLGQARIRNSLGRMGVETRSISSEHDPKNHSPQEIVGYLNG